MEDQTMRVLPWFVPVVGVFLLLSSLAHAFLGWPQIRGELEAAGAPSNLVGAIAAGWYFGSAAMAALGAIVLLSWRELSRQKSMAQAAAVVVAVAYLLFGTLAFLLRSFNPHFMIGFVAPGILLGIPAVFCSWRR
jgi:hypothetical protein